MSSTGGGRLNCHLVCRSGCRMTGVGNIKYCVTDSLCV